MNPRTRRPALLLACATIAPAPAAFGQEPVSLEAPTVEVIGTTPLPGLGVPVEQVPSNVQAVTDRQIEDRQAINLPDLMTRSLPSVNVNEVTGNPFQADVNYRGFQASPLLGTPQGLSVFQDGVRLNEPFGDVVYWDLIPQQAISAINLIPGSNPVFGLNTLGGALSLRTKTGAHYPNTGVQVYGGSWDRWAVDAEHGGYTDNNKDYYISGSWFEENGWRDFSPSEVGQFFAKIGHEDATNDLDLSFTYGDTDLTGNGVTPESMLKQRREQVFTVPDNTTKEMWMVNLTGSRVLSERFQLGGNVYYRSNRIRTLNGDANDDYEDCFEDAVDGGLDPAVECTEFAVNNRTQTDEDSYGAALQLYHLTERHRLTLGASVDRGESDFSQSAGEGVFDQNRGVIETEAEETDNILEGSTTTWSVYLTDTWNIAARTHLTLAARYNNTTVKTTDLLNPTPPNLDADHSYESLNPAIGITHALQGGVVLFGGWSQGTRAPSPIELGCADPNNPCSLPNAMQADPFLEQVTARTWEAAPRPLVRCAGMGGAAFHTDTRTTSCSQHRHQRRFLHQLRQDPATRRGAGPHRRPRQVAVVRELLVHPGDLRVERLPSVREQQLARSVDAVRQRRRDPGEQRGPTARRARAPAQAGSRLPPDRAHHAGARRGAALGAVRSRQREQSASARDLYRSVRRHAHVPRLGRGLELCDLQPHRALPLCAQLGGVRPHRQPVRHRIRDCGDPGREPVRRCRAVPDRPRRLGARDLLRARGAARGLGGGEVRHRSAATPLARTRNQTRRAGRLAAPGSIILTCTAAQSTAGRSAPFLEGRHAVSPATRPPERRFTMMHAVRLMAATLALFSLGATAAPLAYVPNEASGTISVIDTGTDQVIKTIKAGKKPRGLAAVGDTLYVSDQPNNALLVIDLKRNEVVGTIDLGESPEGVGASADGKWVVVASELANGVTFIDAATGKLAFNVKTKGENPEHAVFSPDGKWLYVSAEEADQVDIVDVAARKEVKAVQVAKRPRGIGFLPDGSRAYVACEFDSKVFAIDVATQEVVAEIKAGVFSNGVTVHPSGKRVYISNGKDATVSVIDTATNQVIATIPVGKRPWNMAITPDGKKLYVASGRSHAVSVIDTESNQKIKDIPVGELPWGVLIH
jgi:YVTN family beta-propeller protein